MLDQLGFDAQDNSEVLVAVRKSMEKSLDTLNPSDLEEPDYP